LSTLPKKKIFILEFEIFVANKISIKQAAGKSP
jgi:hypothetical protein